MLPGVVVACALLAGINPATCVEGRTVAFMSDMHLEEQEAWADSGKTQSTIDWFAAQIPRPEDVWVVGDCTVGEHLGSGQDAFRTWADEIQQTTGMYVRPVPGNHDTTYYPANGSQEMYPNGEDPFQLLRSQFSNEFGPAGWYYRDYWPRVRIFACNNMTDTTVWSYDHWEQAYANANPPGRGRAYWGGSGNATYTNPDYAGWSDTLSTQGWWLRWNMQTAGMDWRVLCAHRSSYCACTTNPIRPIYLGARHGMLVPIERHCKLVFGGDTHVASVIQVASGTIYINLKGSYAPRTIDEDPPFAGARTAVDLTPERLPPGAQILWPTSGDGQKQAGVVGALVTFCSDHIRVRLVYVTAYAGPRVVFDQEFYQ